MMDNCCAPQWADFTRSPQVPSDSYFEVEHEVHEPQIYLKSALKSNLPLTYQEDDISEETMSETKFDDSLEPELEPEPESELPASNNVVFFIPHDNKKHSKEEAKHDSLSKAMKNLKLEEKPGKAHEAWNISVSDLTSVFKVSKAEHKGKTTVAVPERIKQRMRMAEVKNVAHSNFSEKNVQANDVKKKSNALAKCNREVAAKSKGGNCMDNNLLEKRLSYKILSSTRRQSNSFKTRRCSMGKSQPKVLTCQYRRRSLMKYRRCSNQFISMAEAVSKFQNGTPQRFRTMSNKEMKPGPLMKVKRSPLKLTYPVSPALRCKQRNRQTTILSQQEREKLEMEEMRKHQIKANPVPVNILKGPSVLKKVAKKPSTITEEFRLTQPKKTRHTAGPHTSAQHQSAADKETKVVAPMSRSNSASNVTKKECTEAGTDVTKPVPFSFESRDKEYLMKKEERLKTLHDQEINKVKADFHARPAPKFSKHTNAAKDQSHKRRTVVPCPFSFEERNKVLAKKKEELVKQLQEQDKKTRTFHANPVPSFKPVAVHGLSKEKEKPVTCAKEGAAKQSKNCLLDQENKQPNIIIKSETEKKEEADAKNMKGKACDKKATKFELNTDKRAKEREEFDEKLRKKEQELEAKRLEEERNRLLKEKQERAELRKMAEIKARPMPVYKPLIVLKSNKPPTSPQSPAWANRPKPRSVS